MSGERIPKRKKKGTNLDGPDLCSRPKEKRAPTATKKEGKTPKKK